MSQLDPAAIPPLDTIGYVRVSTEQQAGEDRTSLAEQRRAITEKARQLGRVLEPVGIFADPGVSGATAERRPGFMAMLRYCEEHPRTRGTLGMVLVLNDSRFGRFEDPEEATHWRFVLKRLGWHVRFCEGDDVEDGIARGVLRFIGSAQASEYRQNIKRTAKRFAASTAREGRWQNEAPLGYRRLATRADGSQRVLAPGQRKADDEVVRLTLGPELEQEVVRFAFQTYAAGEVSIGQLARVLLDRFPARKWSRGTLNALLKNPAYTGDVVWCRRAHDETERRQHWIRPREAWVVAVDAHPALVSRELFATVQSRLARNKRHTRATIGGYPLSGLVRCAHCGDVFTGGGGRRGPAHDPDRYRFYRDRGSVRAVDPCKGYVATLRKRWLEPVIVHEIAKVVGNPRVQAVIAEEIDAVLAAVQGDHRDRADAIGEELGRLTEQRTRLVGAIAGGLVLEREAAATMTELRARIEALETELTRLKFAARRVSGADAIREQLLRLAREFETQALKAGGAALRELVRPWLADAVMDKQTRTLTLYLRKVPDMLGIDLDVPPRRDGRKHSRYIVRRIAVPDSPVHKRAAGGRA